MRRFLPVICLLAATACLWQSPSSPTPVDRQVLIAPGQTVQLTSSDSLAFVAVIGDSRCPLNALCIQGGDAIVRVSVRAGNASGERDLHTGSMQPVTFENYTMEIVDLQPYPFSGRPTDPADYRLTLRIRKP